MFTNFCISIALLFVTSRPCVSQSIEYRMKKAGIVPQFVPNAPKQLCQVKFRYGDLEPGTILHMDQSRHRPIVKWDHRDEGWYTLYLMGITRWSWGLDHEWQHWVVINIPGDNIEAGKELYGYFTPESPMGKKITGKFFDRYVFLIFEQKRPFDLQANYDEKGMYYRFQDNPTLVEFKTQFDIGDPIAGNYFLVAR